MDKRTDSGIPQSSTMNEIGIYTHERGRKAYPFLYSITSEQRCRKGETEGIKEFRRTYPSELSLIAKLKEPHCDSPIQGKREISSEITSEVPVVSAGIQAGNVLKEFVIDNYHLKWSKTLLRGKWTLSRFLDDVGLYDGQQVHDSLQTFGLLQRTLTSDLARLMNRSSTAAIF